MRCICCQILEFLLANKYDKENLNFTELSTNKRFGIYAQDKQALLLPPESYVPLSKGTVIISDTGRYSEGLSIIHPVAY